MTFTVNGYDKEGRAFGFTLEGQASAKDAVDRACEVVTIDEARRSGTLRTASHGEVFRSLGDGQPTGHTTAWQR